MAAISVVIPVYNVQDYLAQSVRSVREQSLSDIEIILVNDGSTDDSGRIAAELASVDSRIVLVNKPNGGLSSARNAGIKAATSEYVCFLDSDDLMESEACSVIVSAFERTGADVVTYGANLYPEFVDIPWMKRTLSPRDVEYRSFSSDLLFREASSPFAWRTACRVSHLNKIGLLFDETLPFGEDQAFQFQLYPRTQHTVLVSSRLVKYRVARPGSFMDTHAYEPVRLAKDHINIAKAIIKDWKNIGFVEDHTAEILDWMADFSFLRSMQLDGEARSEVLDSIEEVLRSYFEEEALRNYSENGLACLFVKAIAFDKRYRFGNKRRLAVYSYLLAMEGKKAVLKRVIDAVGRMHAVAPIARRIDSISKSARNDDGFEQQRKLWEDQDLADRQEANRLLDREVSALTVS